MDTPTLQAVHDELAVIRTLNRYTDAINRRDWAALGEVFTADGIWDVGTGQDPAWTFLLEGRDQIVGGIGGMLGGFDVMIQSNHAVVVTLDGDRAKASSSVREMFRPEGACEGTTIYGTNADDLVRDAGGAWRIACRTFVYTYIETVALPGTVQKRPS